MKRAGEVALVLLAAAPEILRDLTLPEPAIAFQPLSAPSLRGTATGLGVLAVAVLAGLYLTSRRVLTQRAEQAERDLLTEQARADERTRLAAEMHDVVTHRLNLMVLHAGALKVAAKDDDVRKGAEELRTAGCQALEELRDLVGVLRSGRTARIPDVLPDRLANLVADSAATGLEVTLTEHGDADIISPAVRRTMYRVVQESLTNVHKHAPGAHTEITIHCGPSSVRAVIRNAAPPSTPDTAMGRSGSGLSGLRGRVEMVGGTLTAGPTDDGGFEVDAVLPAFVPT
ncbi:histidine kinase [Lentzea sp. NPDC005914]|uniref:sensor histidine kinase n=1 Tax=Lentzea sp. NPDC005914 TaxID=3154572 RepID=UPI0033F6A5C7